MRNKILGPPPDPCGIIISSGRCGSTLLSELIAEEPDTLSVSESLGPVLSHLALPPPAAHVTGAQYWSLLSEPHSSRDVTAKVGSVLGQADSIGRHDGGVPPIMLFTLPNLSAEPERLFATLAEEVPAFPSQPVGLHHKMLLDLLAIRTGKRRWVERSGASSAVAEPLLRAMPAARIVYLTRSIAATALSMSKHMSFRYALARYEFHQRYGTDPYSSAAVVGPLPEAAELPPELRALLPDQITAQGLAELSRDIRRYAAMCASMISLAEQAFADLDPPCLHRIQYEALVSDPVGELTRLGEFLGFADPARWAAAAAGRVRPPRGGAAAHEM
jgi:putative sulfotransferase